MTHYDHHHYHQHHNYHQHEDLPGCHPDTKAVSSPRDGSSSAPCTQTLATFYLRIRMSMAERKKSSTAVWELSLWYGVSFLKEGLIINWNQETLTIDNASSLWSRSIPGVFFITIVLINCDKWYHMHGRSKLTEPALKCKSKPVVWVFLHVQLWELGLLLIVELFVCVRHRLPSGPCVIIITITIKISYHDTTRTW